MGIPRLQGRKFHNTKELEGKNYNYTAWKNLALLLQMKLDWIIKIMVENLIKIVIIITHGKKMIIIVMIKEYQ